MRSKGFTLLELIIASALAVLTASAASVLLIRGLTAARRTEAGLQEMFLLERAAERIGRELRGAVPSAEKHFSGMPGEISFLVSEGPTTLASVRYHLIPSGEGKSLIREWQAFPAGEQPPQAAALLKRVVDFSVLYGIIKKEEGRQRLTWSDAWSIPLEGPSELPELVQVRLESRTSKGESYSVTREFLIPQGVLRSIPSEP